jgi:hypothetical protein
MPYRGWNVRIQAQTNKKLFQFSSEDALRQWRQNFPAPAKRLRRGKPHAQPSRSGVTSKARPQGSLPPSKPLSATFAEGQHPNPVSCIGQAPCLPSAGWMRLLANTATDYFHRTVQLGGTLRPTRSRVAYSTTCFQLRPFVAFLCVSMWVRLAAGERSVSYQSTV